MDHKSEMFDLKREKQELDAFLSSITEADIFAKDAVPREEVLSPVLESQAEPEIILPQPTEIKRDEEFFMKSEEVVGMTAKDEPPDEKVEEFIDKDTDEISLGFQDQPEIDREKEIFFSLPDEEKKKEDFPRVNVTPSIKPLESFKTMTRFDGAAKSAGNALDEISLSDEKKPTIEPPPAKKKDQQGPYDFAPEKKKSGKRIWLWLVILLVVLLAAGVYWASMQSLIPNPVELLKDRLNFSLSSSSSAKEIDLSNVRQRLVYNVKMGKSIRVIEGVAGNLTSHPVSQIKVVANLYGVDGTLLASMESLSGNILPDAQLENLDAAALLNDLQKGKASAKKIPAKGKAPFMVVFTKEVSGVHKLSVVAVDFIKH